MNFYSSAFNLEKGFLHESKQYGEMATGETKIGFVHHDTAESHGFEYERSSQTGKPPKKPRIFEFHVEKETRGVWDIDFEILIDIVCIG
ncbi:MAG: hypothetical protein COT74_08955 [Bdellovibrionales bacterium CG10_big_fil_rev_8_21_14_0_10_45_34]|nr:MAG: hypothetical protein COT74_08955 [Bdellovibrionales bacterium CG10_big_fil_rev_8_21_14_0_10_45_34]